MSKNKRIIDVPVLARVEGEGALEIHIQAEEIKKLQLKIFEPPRLFEKFLEGRSYHEVLDIVARICGICPVAYQMSAVQAIENCFAIKPSPWVRAMRRLFYCGEWIESHSLHIHFLAAPDFLGYPSAIAMAKDYPDAVKRGLRLQSFGNDLIRLFGGRSVHPVGACVGGFFKAPDPPEIQKLLKEIDARLADAEAMLAWVLRLKLPDTRQNFISVSLAEANEYPMTEGRIISDKGLNIPITAFEDYFQERQAPYSTALHCLLKGKPYLVGPLARLNNNFSLIPKEITQFLDKAGIQFPSKNMCNSIIARAVEIFYALLEAKALLANYQQVPDPYQQVQPKAGTGFGCSEAPRGLLWHRYDFDSQGIVQKADIVPPTSQNQARIEEDIRQSLIGLGLEKDDEQLRAFSEMVIRNYDPCISCSTHFLRLKVHREQSS